MDVPTIHATPVRPKMRPPFKPPLPVDQALWVFLGVVALVLGRDSAAGLWGPIAAAGLFYLAGIYHRLGR